MCSQSAQHKLHQRCQHFRASSCLLIANSSVEHIPASFLWTAALLCHGLDRTQTQFTSRLCAHSTHRQISIKHIRQLKALRLFSSPALDCYLYSALVFPTGCWKYDCLEHIHRQPISDQTEHISNTKVASKVSSTASVSVFFHRQQQTCTRIFVFVFRICAPSDTAPWSPASSLPASHLPKMLTF